METKNIKIYLIFLKLYILLACTSAFALTYSEKEQKLKSDFDDVSVTLTDPELRDFDAPLRILQADLKEFGFANAPDLSLKLISNIKQFPSNKIYKLKLLFAARDISPTHPEVLFSIASRISDIGIKESFSYLSKAFSALPDYPYTLFSLLIKILILLLYCFFVALIVTLFGNLVFSSSEIVSFIAGFFIKEMRLGYSSVVLVFLLICPLFIPLFYAALIWSIVAAYSSSRMRLYPLMTSFSIILIILLIPFAENVLKLANSELGRSIENARTGDYVLNISSVLDKASKANNNAFYKVLLGQLNHYIGEEELAQSNFTHAVKLDERNSGLSYVVESNLAQADFQNGKQEVAYAKWKNLYDKGWKEYELLFNLSIASVSLYKKEEYDKYFSELKTRFRSSNLNITQNVKPLLALLPVKSLYLLAIDDTLSSSSIEGVYVSGSQTLKYLEGQAVVPLVSSSFLVFILGLTLIKEHKGRYRFRVSIIADRTLLKAQQFTIFNYFPLFHSLVRKRESQFLIALFMLLSFVSTFYAMPFLISYSVKDILVFVIGCIAFIGIVGTYYRSQIRQEKVL